MTGGNRDIIDESYCRWVIAYKIDDSHASIFLATGPFVTICIIDERKPIKHDEYVPVILYKRSVDYNEINIYIWYISSKLILKIIKA